MRTTNSQCSGSSSGSKKRSSSKYIHHTMSMNDNEWISLQDAKGHDLKLRGGTHKVEKRGIFRGHPMSTWKQFFFDHLPTITRSAWVIMCEFVCRMPKGTLLRGYGPLIGTSDCWSKLLNSIVCGSKWWCASKQLLAAFFWPKPSFFVPVRATWSSKSWQNAQSKRKNWGSSREFSYRINV